MPVLLKARDTRVEKTTQAGVPVLPKAGGVGVVPGEGPSRFRVLWVRFEKS
jgi:hypothetical protein